MKLQKAPLGLLSLLDLKTLGFNPNDFGNGVVGVVDVTELYAATLQNTGNIGANVQVNGDPVTLPVPAGECWRVHSVGGLLVMAAATTHADGVGFRLSYSAPNASSPCVLGAFDSASTVAVAAAGGATYTHGVWLGGTFVAQPGSVFQLTNERAYGAAVPATLRVFYEQLKI